MQQEVVGAKFKMGLGPKDGRTATETVLNQENASSAARVPWLGCSAARVAGILPHQSPAKGSLALFLPCFFPPQMGDSGAGNRCGASAWTRESRLLS